MNLERPGAARLNEVWLRLRDPARAGAVDRALAAKPFNVLEVESRRALEADARPRPDRARDLARARRRRGRGARARSGRDPADGARRPARRAGRAVRSRGSGRVAVAAARDRPDCARSLVAAAGLVAGALTGVALAAVVTDLVGLTARATAAEPPLVLEVDVLVVARRGGPLRPRRRGAGRSRHPARVLGARARAGWRPWSECGRRAA